HSPASYAAHSQLSGSSIKSNAYVEPSPRAAQVQYLNPPSYAASSQLSSSSGSSNRYSQPAQVPQTFDYYQSYGHGSSLRFDEMGAYAVDESYMESWDAVDQGQVDGDLDEL
ncbi:hypothetical protein C0991_000424, partial [Blastosporella zonata]